MCEGQRTTWRQFSPLWVLGVQTGLAASTLSPLCHLVLCTPRPLSLGVSHVFSITEDLVSPTTVPPPSLFCATGTQGIKHAKQTLSLSFSPRPFYTLYFEQSKLPSTALNSIYTSGRPELMIFLSQLSVVTDLALSLAFQQLPSLPSVVSPHLPTDSIFPRIGDQFCLPNTVTIL